MSRLEGLGLNDRTVTVVVDEVRTSAPEFFGLFSGWQWDGVRSKILRAGIALTDVRFVLLRDFPLETSRGVIVGLGESVLRELTGLKSIDKWQLSPLLAKSGRKFIPTFDLDRMNKQFELNLYFEMALQRAAKERHSFAYNRKPEQFHLNPSLEEKFAILDFVARQPEIAVDVETGYGQINTVGFAWSATEAIAINVLPNNMSDETHWQLWDRIRKVLEGPSKKIFQNFIYDVSYFSAYGIRTANITHDTMWAMKVLYPELKSNLGNVGRIYTERPYWKDDGKVTDEEGTKKDWGNIRDWPRHYLYNARDTTGTWEGKQNQIIDLRERGLAPFFESYIMRLTDAISEMCAHGMPISLDVRAKIKAETEAKIAELTLLLREQTGRDLNPSSPKQVMSYLRENKIILPKKYDKATGFYKESADASSLKKVRLKHPDLIALGTLADVKSFNTALSRYINFNVKPNEAKLRYSLNGCGTETLRNSGHKDGWGRGFNILTIPQEGGDVSIKQMMIAPEGQTFIEIDLRQAESRFVAYDSADKTLIDMLESGDDVHKHVAHEILKGLGKPATDYSKHWRQLGKKSGHGANYDMKAGVFVETCFAEMDVVLAKKEAETILAAYHNLFPGIRTWHKEIQRELWQHRKLKAPSGWERYFYGRYGSEMHREAYAWRPQHTIPWITNHLMFHLLDQRKVGKLEFNLHTQIYDALYLTSAESRVEDIIKVCLDHRTWHPSVTLKGGQMYIPIEAKTGKCLAKMEEWK